MRETERIGHVVPSMRQPLAAYDPLDPNGNITVKWDIMSWTPDGYVAVVTMNNFQMYRHIMSPGWTLGWMWARKEVIWAAVGAEATEQVVPCPSCTCGCHDKSNCVQSGSKIVSTVEDDATEKSNVQPLPQCTRHMCPVRVHWHVTLNYKDYWRVKVSITNFNYRMNYTLWTLVIQYPNFINVTQVFSFDYKPLVAYDSINDTGMFYGLKFYNDHLMEAGKFGHVQSEMLLKKDKNTFTLREGWAFPRKVYFNGDECQLPPPDVYPFLPNSAHETLLSFSPLISSFTFLFIVIW
ncbi:hypothetical protein C1H46_030408 [Malus baccata]|uniref:COBRA C-terminal domain-containing protein n=1 Tax=Malus baccata TaxID=106549 RepID=A0A540LC16_MALBA|nr:hypothetical protein C1H46_030408 [Malus baccata]